MRNKIILILMALAYFFSIYSTLTVIYIDLDLDKASYIYLASSIVIAFFMPFIKNIDRITKNWINILVIVFYLFSIYLSLMTFYSSPTDKLNFLAGAIFFLSGSLVLGVSFYLKVKIEIINDKLGKAHKIFRYILLLLFIGAFLFIPLYKIIKPVISQPKQLTKKEIQIKQSSDNWKIYEESALMISNQSSKVQELFSMAKIDKHLISENSTFNKTIDKICNITVSDYNIDEKSQYNELIPVVFMMILEGLEYMHIKDWKSLSDEKEMIWSVNTLLKQRKKIQLSEKEKKTIHKEMLYYLKDEHSIKKQIAATNEMVHLLEKFVQSRDLYLLWFQNESDSYGMSIVDSVTYKALNGKKLDDSCSFSISHFTLEMM